MPDKPAQVQRALEDQIRVLSREVWEEALTWPDVARWLENFKGDVLPVDEERLLALHLLANFDFFGLREIRELLRAIYRDLFRYPIVQRARNAQGGTRDAMKLEHAVQQELNATRFLGMGNPSESGAHLLYYFRQVNRLSKRYFIHQHEILDHAPGDPRSVIAIPGLTRLVFIDDIMGSGTQAVQYSARLLEHVREAAARSGVHLEICYFTMFARPKALDLVRTLHFDVVEAVHEIDDSELAFSARSRVYAKPAAGISAAAAEAVARHYGQRLQPGSPLGYKDGQLLLGMHHNIPDNTLPIFWAEETAMYWGPAFKRHGKIY